MVDIPELLERVGAEKAGDPVADVPTRLMGAPVAGEILGSTARACSAGTVQALQEPCGALSRSRQDAMMGQVNTNATPCCPHNTNATPCCPQQGPGLVECIQAGLAHRLRKQHHLRLMWLK